MSHRALGAQFKGPLFHGTNAELKPGESVYSKDYDAYATYDRAHAQHFGKHVYEVQPTGRVHEDPDWMDHPPNPSVYSHDPMTVVRKH